MGKRECIYQEEMRCSAINKVAARLYADAGIDDIYGDYDITVSASALSELVVEALIDAGWGPLGVEPPHAT